MVDVSHTDMPFEAWINDWRRHIRGHSTRPEGIVRGRHVIHCDDPACRWKIKLPTESVGKPTSRTRPLDELLRHRATFIEYARHRLEDEDWHGLSDAANDLRELDVEIRMTEAQQP